jgi:hypothetical protein
VPLLVGGSGLYIDALRRGLHPEPPKDAVVRARLQSDCETAGVEAMHARLAALDPDAARTLKTRDRQRVLRALEVVEVSGHTLGWWREHARQAPLAADWHAFQLVVEPAALRARIAARTEAMWRDGLLEETRALVAAGKEEPLRRLAAIGYDEALDVLAGRLAPEARCRRSRSAPRSSPSGNARGSVTSSRRSRSMGPPGRSPPRLSTGRCRRRRLSRTCAMLRAVVDPAGGGTPCLPSRMWRYRQTAGGRGDTRSPAGRLPVAAPQHPNPHPRGRSPVLVDL